MNKKTYLNLIISIICILLCSVRIVFADMMSLNSGPSTIELIILFLIISISFILIILTIRSIRNYHYSPNNLNDNIYDENIMRRYK